MTDQTGSPPQAVPELMQLDWGDLRHALRQGWRDFLAEPLYGAFFSMVYVACGWLLVFAFTAKGQVWWTLPASAGFPILGPFVACGFYEISRRREAGQGMRLAEILGAVVRQKDRQIPSMAAVVVVFFLFWNFLSHMIFALFLGKATMTNVSSSVDIFLTVEGMTSATYTLEVSPATSPGWKDIPVTPSLNDEQVAAAAAIGEAIASGAAKATLAKLVDISNRA